VSSNARTARSIRQGHTHLGRHRTIPEPQPTEVDSLTKTLEPFLMPVPWHTLANDPAGGDIQRGEQRHCRAFCRRAS